MVIYIYIEIIVDNFEKILMLFGKVILGKNLFFLFYKEMIIMIEGYLV